MEQIEQEIKTCFTLYLNYMKSQIKNLKGYNVDEMSISQIRIQLDVIHMQYIVSSFSISKTSTGYVSYMHLKQMIDNYTITKSEKLINMENDIESLKQEMEILKNKSKNDQEVEIIDMLNTPLDSLTNDSYNNVTIEEQKKGWFFG